MAEGDRSKGSTGDSEPPPLPPVTREMRAPHRIEIREADLAPEAAGVADVAGDTAVNEMVTQTPVNYEDTVKGPAGDTDPATQQWRKENWVHDPVKAREMAEAGDNMRSRAAEEREIVRDLETYGTTHKEIVENPDNYHRKNLLSRQKELTPEAQDKLIEAHRLANKNLHRINVTGRGEVYKLPDLAAQEVLTGEPNASLESVRESQRRQAERWDRIAERDEYWAGFLHDHPIPDAYKAEHPDFNFGPHSIRWLENTVEDDERGLNMMFVPDGTELDDPQGRDLEAIDLSIRRAFEQQTRRGIENEDLVERYKGLVVDGSSTVNDFISLYKTACEQVVQVVKGEAEERKKILEDIKSGRASHPPEPGASEQAAA